MVETMYKQLFSSAPVPIVVTDQKGTIKLVNEQADSLLDHKRMPLEGLGLCDFIDHSFLKTYLREKPCLSFEEFLQLYKNQSDHWIKGKEGITIYADIKAVSFKVENEDFYIWTFDPIQITRKLTYDLNERVKEQLTILNVIDLCFQNPNIPATLQLCLQPIRHGWQFPEVTEVRITLSDGEVYATDNFKKTESCLQGEIMTVNEQFGFLEVCYTDEVPKYGGKTFLYEEERLINVLAKILGTFLEHWYANKRIDEAVLDAQEEERYQLGMELHDNVQQILVAISLNVGHLQGISNDESSRKVLDRVKDYLSEAIKELRRLSQQLAPSIDPACLLVDRIKVLTASMNVHDTLKIKIDGNPCAVLNEKIQLGLYRIIQEQLTNIVKHAKTTGVEISIKADGPNILLSIVDDGVGFDMSSQKNGIGFENIRRRTASMNGSLHISSSPGKGTRVTVQVPMGSTDAM